MNSATPYEEWTRRPAAGTGAREAWDYFRRTGRVAELHYAAGAWCCERGDGRSSQIMARDLDTALARCKGGAT